MASIEPWSNIKPDLPPEKRLLYEEGICLECKGDDVECTRDCAWHICLDCGYVPEKEYRVE